MKATITPAPADTRPEPPETFPVQYAIAYWARGHSGKNSQWVGCVRVFTDKEERDSCADSMSRLRDHYRIVGIVTVGGDA